MGSELKELIIEIVKEEKDKLMSQKEWNAGMDKIEKHLEWMDKQIDKAIKDGDKKSFDYYMDYIDKFLKIAKRK
jgi:hypothetical protein